MIHPDPLQFGRRKPNLTSAQRAARAVCASSLVGGCVAFSVGMLWTFILDAHEGAAVMAVAFAFLLFVVATAAASDV